MGVEIERKFTVKKLPDNLDEYSYHQIEQGYLNVSPAIRVRRQDDTYYMTYKGKGIVSHEEYNLALDKESYEHMVQKADGNVIRKKRYLIPLNQDAYSSDYLNAHPEMKNQIESMEMKIELDVFDKPFDGLIVAEVEFPTDEAASVYKMADWFEQDVTDDRSYSNAQMSRKKFD